MKGTEERRGTLRFQGTELDFKKRDILALMGTERLSWSCLDEIKVQFLEACQGQLQHKHPVFHCPGSQSSLCYSRSTIACRATNDRQIYLTLSFSVSNIFFNFQNYS